MCENCGENNNKNKQINKVGAKPKYTIEDCLVFAESRNFKLLETEFINSYTKMKWQCITCGNIWEETLSNVKKTKHGCLKCAGRIPSTLEEIRNLAISKGGVCLNEGYPEDKIKSNDRVKFKCSNNHVWETSLRSVKNNGAWCNQCVVENKKYTLEDCKKVAESRGGKCISIVYIDNQTKMEWECSEKHRWFAVFASVIDTLSHKGSWCDVCFRNKNNCNKITIEEAYELAKLKNLTCLFNKIDRAAEDVEWKCNKNGHIFYNSYKNIKSNTYDCPVCLKESYVTLNKIQEICEQNGGKCISTELINSNTKLEIECAEKHIWLAKPNTILRGSWCLICSGSNKHTIEDCQKLAQEMFNGKCLSTVYVNNKVNMLWRCFKDHEWEACYKSISNGSGCPYCHVYVCEEEYRKAFELLLGYKFNKIRPKWLLGPKRSMELDGYCEELNLAFEYHGRQHYEIVKDFKMTEEILKQQQERDKLKLKICAENNVNLIVIKYKKYNKPSKILLEVEEILKKQGYI